MKYWILYIIVGNGDCVDYDICSCEPGWTGESCETADCGDLGQCSSQGICISPDHCYCYDGFEGANCSQPLSENISPPIVKSCCLSCFV